MNRIVSLRNREGHTLHCMLEEPAAGIPPAGIAAVLLCPGVKTRVGPHRLYRKVSAPFLARGIPVLRVDFRGIGDSGGEWPDDALVGIYQKIELGHCADDARAALDWLESHLGIRRCIVGGLCGAAVTALGIAREDPRMVALYAIGLPVVLAAAAEPPAMSARELHSHGSLYLRKLFQPASWLRLLSLKSDYRLLLRAVANRLRPRKAAAAPATTGLNPYVTECMQALLASGRHALLLFGERDPRRWDFEDKFLQASAASLAPYQSQIHYSLVPGANHILGHPAAVAAANQATEEWLDSQVTRGIVRSERDAPADGLHSRALECSPLQEAIPCSTNES